MPSGNIPDDLVSQTSSARVPRPGVVQEGEDVPPDYTRRETLGPEQTTGARVPSSRVVQEGEDIPPNYARRQTLVPGVIPMQANLSPALAKPQPPVTPAMKFLNAREESFKNLPPDMRHIDTRVIAEAGFFCSAGKNKSSHIPLDPMNHL
jgi:hypothetical protein